MGKSYKSVPKDGKEDRVSKLNRKIKEQEKEIHQFKNEIRELKKLLNAKGKPFKETDSPLTPKQKKEAKEQQKQKEIDDLRERLIKQMKGKK